MYLAICDKFKLINPCSIQFNHHLRISNNLMSKVNPVQLFCIVIFMQILNCQTYLNYVTNWNFQNSNCTNAQLSAQYSCLLRSSSQSWGSNRDINLQYGYNFYSTSSSSIVASLDFYESGYYNRNSIFTHMYPITVGTYRLTFTAYTRKTGTAADYYFYVSVYGYSGYNYINNKTYQFTSLGSMPITETITISAPPNQNLVYLQFSSKSISPFSSTPFAVGISDVKFVRTSACNSNETSVVLVTGETACIQNSTIQSVNYCTSWNYYHYYFPTGAFASIRKFYSCSSCSAGKLVGVYDNTLPPQSYSYNRYGCTINQIPNTWWYRRLMIQNQNGKYFYSTQTCNGSSSYYLIVPNVSFSGYDVSRPACISYDSSVSRWQVANSTYYPAICSASGYFPVITSSTSRVCQLISSPIANCAIYLADFTCKSCSSNATLMTWNNSGTLTNLCMFNVYNCITYVVVSSVYVCSACDTGYALSTLSTLNSVKVCIRNDLIDGNCTTYALSTNKNYECTVCATGFTLSTVNTTAGQIKRCLSTTTQIIRSCLVYEGITGGYGCYQCSAVANIARYLFTYNSLSAYRCLNTLSEYITNCETYDLVSSLYKCSVCSNNYLLANVTINSVVQLKCLTTATQVVSNCNAYGVDGLSNYVCSSCATGYTSQTISNILKCLPDIVIDAQCTTYILNGSNFECSACTSLYTVSSVFTASVTYKYCFLTTSLIRDCSVYEPISGGGYQCNECSSQPSIARYTFLLDGVQAYRCLNSASEYVSSCSTYQLASQIYTCTACSTGYQMKSIVINSVSQPRCLNSLTQIVSSCTAYVTDPTNEYVCSSCSSSYSLKIVSGVPKCISDIALEPHCTTYILNGSNFECSACDSGNNLRTVSGVPKCIPEAETIDKCTNYTLDTSDKLSCNICDAGYTLMSVSGVNKCLPDKVIDSQCTTYILNENSFECSQCNSLYSLQNVFKNAETFKNCLLTSSEVIRHCEVYEINSQKYECKQCSSTQNIARYSFTFDGYQTHRCLNSLTEYVEFCTTYQLSSQVYSCTLCETAYQRSDVTVNQAEKVKCLTKANEVVQDCKHYAFDSVSSTYSCDQCDNGFTLKTDSDSNICVHDGNVQDGCIQYEDNGNSEVCTKCSTSFTLSDVTVGNVLTVQCLSNDDEAVKGCKKYEQISLSYDCTECHTTYSKETVVIHAKSTFRCLLQASEIVEDCLAYSVNSDEDFVCNSCSTGFSLQNGIYHEKVCSHNANVQSHCIQYKDDGVIEVCTKCQTLFQLGTVSLNGNSVTQCLQKSSQIVTGCKTYEEIGGVFDCIQCNTEYSKENVVILAIGYTRCLLKTTQIVEDCQNYLVDGQGNYACGECKQNYSLKAGVGGNICASNSNVENNCLQYRDNGAEEECFKCQTGFTVSQVNVTATPDKMRKKCLSNSLEVIKGCKFYQLASDGKYLCTDCNTGFTKSDVKIESTTQVRCLSSTENVQDCSTYIVNQANLYLCDGCDSGYTLENSTKNKVCVKADFIEDHCIEYRDKGATEECIKCEANYTLSVVFSGQSQSSQCLETRTKLITGCKTYELLPSQELQCKECDSAHSLQPVYETQTKFSQKCIANEDVVPECLGYFQVGLSCAHDCNSCSSGFQLAVVKIPHRITNGCLSLAEEYLPFCLLHGTEHGEYYCRHGVCEKDTFSVFIGSGETQIACATDSLIEFVDDENCLYFERPRFGATELKCQKCKDGFSEPHCKPIIGYQGLTSGN